MEKQKLEVPTVAARKDFKMPVIGLGTWRLSRNAGDVVNDAIEVGYRHIDCAHIYGNEAEIGKRLRQLMEKEVVKREDLFITSKLWNTFHKPSMVKPACQTTLKNLNLKYLDNYLIHWPMGYKEGDELYPKDDDGKLIFSSIDYIQTWKAMEELVDEGLCLSIGLSNFNMKQIQRILNIARISPSNLQIECHPYLNQKELMDFCAQHNICVTAYSPLGSPSSPYEKPGEFPILKNPKVLNLANKYEKTTAQILLRYQLDRGNVVIPRSANKEHMAENIDLLSFELEKEDVMELDSLDFNGRFMTMAVSKGHPYHPFE